MSMTDYATGGDVKTSLCQLINANVNGAAIDVRNYDGNIAAIINAAAGTGTTPTLDIKIQDSADGSTGWADFGVAFTQLTTTAAIQSKVFKANKTKGYIRFVGTVGGTSPSYAAVSAIVLAVKRY